jgi:hypothetical protein
LNFGQLIKTKPNQNQTRKKKEKRNNLCLSASSDKKKIHGNTEFGPLYSHKAPRVFGFSYKKGEHVEEETDVNFEVDRKESCSLSQDSW